MKEPSISIHAPCTGSDAGLPHLVSRPADFNPRSLHGERQWSRLCSAVHRAFQSTLPARGATSRRSCRMRPRGFQSTLPARGATGAGRRKSAHAPISIHAPCTGSDPGGRYTLVYHNISIHAPCTGSDAYGQRRSARVADFNPRSLHGERRYPSWENGNSIPFQSTLPARGATWR